MAKKIIVKRVKLLKTHDWIFKAGYKSFRNFTPHQEQSKCGDDPAGHKQWTAVS